MKDNLPLFFWEYIKTKNNKKIPPAIVQSKAFQTPTFQIVKLYKPISNFKSYEEK